MTLIKSKSKTKNSPSRSQPKRLTSAETFWKQVDQQTHYLIADTLNQALPLPNCRDLKIFDPHQDADYRTLLADYENNYAEENLPTSEVLAEEIAYEYLLLVSKSLLHALSTFACHQPEYLEGLTE